MSETIRITGHTFPVRDQLKALGGRWDADARGWRVPAEKAEEARALANPPRRGLPHGQLWQPCERRGCSTEPVCVSCERCERHCACPPPPTAEEQETSRLREQERRAAAMAARAAFLARLEGDDWEPTAFPIERCLSNGAWIPETEPDRIGLFLDLVLARESWYAPRVKRDPLPDRRELLRFLARTGKAINHGDDWYAEIRLPVPLEGAES
jgi:hypothetical protein